MAPTDTDTNMAELTTNCQVVETEKTHLTTKQQELVKRLLAPDVQIEAAIPEDAAPEDLWETLGACVGGLHLLNARLCKLKPIIGRILLIFRNRPSLYKTLGYDNWTHFIKTGVEETLHLDMRSSSAWEAITVARDWPQLNPDRYAKIGPKKLNIISKVATGRSPNAEVLLQTAESMSVREFKQLAETRHWIAPGEVNGATWICHTNQDRYHLFRSFFADPLIQEWVGSKDPDKIMEAMIAECYNPWLDQLETRKQQQFEEVKQ